ncbi:AIP3-domain-containing protein [Sistotremastrum niveocremeum HHB9708]|uniref:AIP3-domain-containing protein n=1 Tax=Sistotremastrum niveocremeum HHB9708 TaxID=1314777 RepID=A0A164VTA0_9AGAM|nr:AIP3-domain-containing protein [Sistotremastrum niveocremeum HHB9708]
MSSTSSSGSRRSRGGSGIESAVTRLLVAIKQLLESLTQWSTGRATEEQVSNVYVQLGNDFNAATAAFQAQDIDMSDLSSVPDDLRDVLERCLAEDATQANLEIYLPEVRRIITSLLQGLRSKQTEYKDNVASARERRRGSSNRVSSNPQSPPQTDRNSSDYRSPSPFVTPSSRYREVTPTIAEEPQASAHSRTDSTPSPEVSMRRSDSPASGSSRPTQPVHSNSFPPPVATASSSTRSSVAESDNLRRGTSVPGGRSSRSERRDVTINGQSPPQPPHPQVPPDVVRYSLSDPPVQHIVPPPPEVVINVPSPTLPEDPRPGPSNPVERDQSPPSPLDEPSQPLDTPPLDSTQAPVMANSLAALKKSDALERRASKRFSSYTYNKMAGMARGMVSSGSAMLNRKSVVAGGSSLTPSELAFITEGDETPGPMRKPSRGRLAASPTIRSTTPSPDEREGNPPVPAKHPALEPPLEEEPEPETEATDDVTQTPTPPDTQFPNTPATITVFLQVGRQVRKVTLEPQISMANLRVLFVDKFAYNPGQENFPEIYIRDLASGIQYELEDVSEIKDKCLLSLNIEPLDQIKQHIDAQMSSLAQEIKDLRQAVGTSRRLSVIPPPANLTPQTPIATPSRPTEQQFRDVARRLSRIHPDDAPPPKLLQPQTTGTSVAASDTTSVRIVSDLKTQFDEVQNLRRDLGVLKQIYMEFMNTTKESLGTLRLQTQSVRQIANSKIGGAREYINSGKASLDTRSQSILTRVEDLQDTVENLKDDVIKRHVTPRMHIMRNLRGDIDKSAEELTAIQDHLKTIKPMWKKTWEEELQNIVEEQQFLQHQEEFVNDLLEDHKALTEIFGHVEKVISIRNAASTTRQRTFRQLPLPEDGTDGLGNVMLEIRGAAVDPERRMRAIEANQRQREREQASRTDEFEQELTGFVSGKKLKMTGGAEEVERMRQKKSEATLKAMFTGGKGQ